MVGSFGSPRTMTMVILQPMIFVVAVPAKYRTPVITSTGDYIHAPASSSGDCYCVGQAIPFVEVTSPETIEAHPPGRHVVE